MQRLLSLLNKEEKLVIGLMSGTSVDGIDTALVKIKGHGLTTQVELVAFENYPFPSQTKDLIFSSFNEATSSSELICHLNFVLGELYAQAIERLCETHDISLTSIDLVGCHGQTIYHQPNVRQTDHIQVKSTLQIGEGSIIAKKLGIVTINDFRVGDMALGGLGAPLVPYPEFLMYRHPSKNIALQNIGGIGNVTILKAEGQLEDIFAFDTGPGNMIMDRLISMMTNGQQSYDDKGMIAASGTVCEPLLSQLLDDEYFKLAPPKTTGREYFGDAYCEGLIEKASKFNINFEDIIATATALTAESIALAYHQFSPVSIDEVIVGGGGSYNDTLMNMLSEKLNCRVITQEAIGYNSDAKEAIAFAILANELIHSNETNCVSVTQAKKPTILGKIIL